VTGSPTAGLPLFSQKPARKRSRTSIDAARSSGDARGKRREHVYLAIASSDGLARFQIAQRLGVSDHWISSSVAALIKAGRIQESPDRAITNPQSGKRCAILVVIPEPS
jgi:DNA-binding MarR family transcriptional regulator